MLQTASVLKGGLVEVQLFQSLEGSGACVEPDSCACPQLPVSTAVQDRRVPASLRSQLQNVANRYPDGPLFQFVDGHRRDVRLHRALIVSGAEPVPGEFQDLEQCSLAEIFRRRRFGERRKSTVTQSRLREFRIAGATNSMACRALIMACAGSKYSPDIPNRRRRECKAPDFV